MNNNSSSNIYNNLTPSQKSVLETCDKLFTPLHRTYLADDFIGNKLNSFSFLTSILDNLSWGQKERTAAYVRMFSARNLPKDAMDLMNDKMLPTNLRLYIFATNCVNYKFNFSWNKKYIRFFNRTIYKAIQQLPIHLAYELAMTPLNLKTSNIKRLKVLFTRKDLNYLVFSRAVNTWNYRLLDKFNVADIKPAYKVAERFLNRMSRKGFHKLVYVFATGVYGTFPEIKNFDKKITQQIGRLFDHWQQLSEQARVRYLQQLELPEDPQELPEDWLRQLVTLPDLELLEPIGVWDGSN